MSTHKNNMDPHTGDSQPGDPVLDGLLDEAFSAKRAPARPGMNDRILAAMAEAHKASGVDSDGNEGHVVASIGIVRWVWVGMAAAAAFAVSGVLLMQGSLMTSGSGPAISQTPGTERGTGAAAVAILEMDMSRFSELGRSEKDPLDRDLAALNNKIDELNKMWVTEPERKSGISEF
jgi:hypothetical protein